MAAEEESLDVRLLLDKRCSAATDFMGLVLLSELRDERTPNSVFKLDADIFEVCSNPAARSSVFDVPTFTERFYGWRDDLDITTGLVALPAFIMHAVNSMRLSKLLIYTSAAITEESGCVGSVINPVVDLALEFLPLSRAFDGDMCANVRQILEIMGRVSNWWKGRILSSISGSSGSSAVTLDIMRSLHEKLAEVALNPPRRQGDSEFYNHVWWLLSQIISSFLSSTARMMAAVNTMVSTYLHAPHGLDHEDDAPTRKQWKYSWDANMYYLTTSGMSMTSECQYRGLGKISDRTVMMPNFDGSFTRELEAALKYRLTSDTHPDTYKAKTRMVTAAALRAFNHQTPETMFNGFRAVPAEAQESAGPRIEEISFEGMHMTETDEAKAYQYCRKLFTLFVVRGHAMKEVEESTSNVYLPPVRWDTVLSTSNIFKESLRIDMMRPPEWLPLFVRFSQGSQPTGTATGTASDPPSDQEKRVPYKCGIFNTGHMLEIFRIAEWKTSPAQRTTGTSRRRKHKTDRVRVQVRTVLVNPVFWGALGVIET